MNKKVVNGFLIVLLLVIWGSVFFKFFKGENVSVEAQDYFSSLPQLENYMVKKDSFSLTLNDRDPFKVSKIKVKIPVKEKTRPTKVVTKAPAFQWPNVSYYGFVKNNINSERLVFLKINGNTYRKRVGEAIDDIKIFKAYSDSLIIKSNKEYKTIFRTHE